MPTTPQTGDLQTEDQEGKPATKTFEDAMAQMVTRTAGRYNSAGKAAITQGAIMPAVAVMMGAGARLLLGPSTAWAITESLGAVAAMVALLAFTTAGALGRVDWATATPYWHGAGAGVHPRNRALMNRVINQTLDRYRRISNVHVYLHPCPHAPGAGCGDPSCNNAGVLAVGRRRVVYLGTGTAGLPTPELEVVLRHEIRHTTGIMHLCTPVIASARIIGWIGIGYIAGGWSLVPATVGFYVVLAGAFWAFELACDHAAVQGAGRSAAVASFESARRVQRANAATRSRRARAGWWLYRVLVPSHPPIWLRVAFTRTHAHEAS